MSSDRAFLTGILGESYFLPPHMLTLSLGRGICNQGEWEGCDSSFISPLKDSILRQPDNDLEATFTEWLFFFSPAFFISLCTSPSGTTCFIKISKEIWPGPLSCTTWTKRKCKRICAERSPSYVLCGMFVFPTWHLWSHLNSIPRGYQKFFSRAVGIFGVGRRPKPWTAKPR